MLTTDSYDSNGNTTLSSGISFTYDFENRLLMKGAVINVYDGDGNRVSETAAGTTTSYLVDTLNPTGYSQVMDELVSGAVTRTYTFGLQRISENQLISGTRFPPLYEQLVLSYRWAEVDLQSFTLLGNPPGSDLTGLLAEVEKDKGLTESLIPAGFIKFGKGPDMDYDPVCFDIKSRTKRKDYRIVNIDHEEILCNYRVKIVAELAPSFEQLVVQTIERADLLKR